jgi:hypothetical protein
LSYILGGQALVLYGWMVVSYDDLKFHEGWTVSKDNALPGKVKN